MDQETGMAFAPPAAQNLSVASDADAARETALVQAQFVAAWRNPRQEQQAFNDVIQKIKDDPDFAATAIYVFPRGGTKIEGPSVNLARLAASRWHHLISGFEIVDINAQYYRVRGWSLDLETNVRKFFEITGRNLIYRSKPTTEYGNKTGWLVPNERDQRELTSKAGAIAERNVILQLLPRDMVDAWVRECKAAIKKSVSKDMGSGIEGRSAFLRNIVVAFSQFQVTQAMIEKYIECPLDHITDEQATELRGIYKTLDDGAARREEFFEVPKPAAAKPSEKKSGLDKAAEAAKKEDAEKAPQKPRKGRKGKATARASKPNSASRGARRAPRTAKPAPSGPAPGEKTQKERLEEIATQAAAQGEAPGPDQGALLE